MTHDEMIAIIEADKKGLPIECIHKYDYPTVWTHYIGNGGFDFHSYEYRIKQTKPTVRTTA